MRIRRHLYDLLKRLEANEGFTKEIPMDGLDLLIQKELIAPFPPYGSDYRYRITPRGLAAMEDRPL